MVVRENRVASTKRRGTKPLTRKLIRDLKKEWKSFVAVWIICMLAITLYVGIDATWRCIEIDLDQQFEASNLADIWVRGELSDRAVRDIEAIQGVNRAQRRVAKDSKAEDLEGEPIVRLLMNDGEATINKPLVRQGTAFQPNQKNQCILQERFAQYHGLNVGDTLHLKIGQREVDLYICALGNLPEYVVTSDGSEFSPSMTRFGYASVSAGTLSDIPYGEVVLTLKPDANVKQVKENIHELTKDQRTVVNERMDVFGIKMAMEEAQQVRAMGAIFPMVFFVIAALITWTTMSRLVENQRLMIGSLFALGYGRGKLTLHYAMYGLIIAVLGALSGLAGARYGIAPILMQFMQSLYFLPDAVPYLSPWVIGGVSAVLAVITGGASILSARYSLRQTPATLLRPKPPAKGKRLFIENIKFIWNRFSFSGKMILRNMFRNKVRLLMGLIGALGCTAMMLAGYGMRDSVNYVMVNHYTRTMHYDARATLEQNVPVDYPKSVALRAGAEAYEEEMITSTEAFIRGEWLDKTIHVLENNHKMVYLSDENGTQVILPSVGVALTRKAAEDYGMALGDQMLLRMSGGRAVETKVSSIVDLQLGQGIYMSRSAWDGLDLWPWMPTDVMLKGADLKLNVVEDMDGVDKVRTLDQERSSNGTVLNIMNVIVVLLVLFSGVLALVVFYNLGQLNFSERIRELATLKVLGFNNREIKKLVLRENMIITLIGLPIGLLCGPQLLYVLLTYGLPNTIQFVRHIEPMSWAYTCGFTILFAMIVNWMLGAKFKSVNMVEALKSVE